MDNNSEAEPPKTERVISLDQDFPLFGSESKIPPTPIDTYNISSFHLDINGKLRIPLEVSLHRQGTTGRTIAFTPFRPELGYKTSPEDYNSETRKAKLEGVLSKAELINYSHPPFNLAFLEVGKGGPDLNRIGINKKVYLSEKHLTENQKQNLAQKLITVMWNVASFKKNSAQTHDRKPLSIEYSFPPETLDVIKRLRLLLTFPTGSFAAKPNEIDMYHNGTLSFPHFYPSDQGPFPKIPKIGDMYQGIHDGHFIFVPTDPKELSQIRAKFVLVDEQSQEKM